MIIFQFIRFWYGLGALGGALLYVYFQFIRFWYEPRDFIEKVTPHNFQFIRFWYWWHNNNSSIPKTNTLSVHSFLILGE